VGKEYYFSVFTGVPGHVIIGNIRLHCIYDEWIKQCFRCG